VAKILISAGEASGEMYGAQLIEALRRRDSTLEFFGAGGDRMRAAGCKTVVDAKDLSVVGITEIISHLPKIWGLFNHLIAEANAQSPELAIVIDSRRSIGAWRGRCASAIFQWCTTYVLSFGPGGRAACACSENM